VSLMKLVRHTGGSRAHLDRMSEALLDGEGKNLDSDVLSLLMQSGVEDPKKVALNDRGADAAKTKIKDRKGQLEEEEKDEERASTHFDSA